ncbi:unnamed protein product [Dibothriocephalus latus]|uniref:Uncharacterized protein n=1 Tax=Dibothriocephalus latus TaxID=60516 RepID=A0A3P7P4S9_DIBLA|nr:unnamed protein product [Dibothriocephalus latus]
MLLAMSPCILSPPFCFQDTHLLDLSAFTIDGGPKITTFSIVPNIGVEDRYLRGQIFEFLRAKINKIERAQRSSDILPFITTSAALIYDAMLLFGPALLTHVMSGQFRQQALSCDAEDTFWSAGELLVNTTKSVSPQHQSVLQVNYRLVPRCDSGLPGHVLECC